MACVEKVFFGSTDSEGAGILDVLFLELFLRWCVMTIFVTDDDVQEFESKMRKQ